MVKTNRVNPAAKSDSNHPLGLAPDDMMEMIAVALRNVREKRKTVPGLGAAEHALKMCNDWFTQYEAGDEKGQL